MRIVEAVVREGSLGDVGKGVSRSIYSLDIFLLKECVDCLQEGHSYQDAESDITRYSTNLFDVRNLRRKSL